MAPSMPDPTEYAQTVAALASAQEGVETMTQRLRRTVDLYEDTDAGPTAEDVAELFTLVDELDTATSDLTAKRDQLQEILVSVNLARLETVAAV